MTIPDFRAARVLSPEEQERFEAQEERGAVGEFLGGLVVGARRDPLAGFIVDRVAQALPGVGVDSLEQLELSLGESGASQAGQVIGEWGSILGLGFGSFGLGRAAVGAVLRTGAKSSLTNPQILARVGGGALGVGTEEGAREAARGGDAGDIAQAAAIGAALTAGFEGALVGAGKLLAPKARQFDRAELREQFRTQAREFAEGQIGGVGRDSAGRPRLVGKLAEVSKLRGRLQAATGELEYQRFLARGGGQAALFAEDVALEGAERVQGTLFAAPTLGKALVPKTPVQKLEAQVRGLQRRVGQKETEIRALRELPEVDGTLDARILQAGPSPVGEGQIHELRQLFRLISDSPERYASRLGVTTTRALQMFEDKEVVMEAVRRPQNLARLGRFVQELGDEFGVDVRPFMKRGEMHLDKVGQALLPVFDQYERGIRFGGKKDVLFDQLEQMLRQTYEPLAKMGAQPLQSAQELTAKGVARYLPQVMKDISEKRKRAVLEGVLRKQNPELPQEEIAARAANIMSSERDFGVSSIGSVEHERVLGGTLKEKMEAGLMEDPVTGIMRYMNSVAEREELAKRFGFKGELRGTLVELARQEGADPGAVGSLLDHFLHRKWEPHARRRLAQSVTSLQSALKLTLAAVPNITQPANNALAFGFRSAAHGVGSALTKEGRRGVGAEVMGLLESEFGIMNRAFSGVQSAGFLDKVAQGTLKYTGFTATERFARLASANAGAYFIEKRIAQAVTGRLRGTNRELVKQRLAELGIDLERLLKQGGRRMAAGEPTRQVVDSVLGANTFSKGVYRAAQMTQFIPGSTKIPLLWQNSLGRVLFQFKSFAFQQGKLIRDTVLAEAAKGNLAPAGTFLAIYPISGEFVAGTLAGIKGKPRETDNPLVRFVEDVSYLGAGGLLQSALVNAQYGRLGDFLLGPTGSDAVALTEGLIRSASSFDPRPLGGPVARQPLLRSLGRAPELVLGAAQVGLAGFDQMEELLGEIDSGPTQAPIGLGELRDQFRE